VKSFLLKSLVCLCAALTVAQAQSASSSGPAASSTPQTAMQGPVKDPVTASLRLLLPRSEKNTVGAVEAMPADKYSYKPTPEQMTFAHLAVHIIGFNNTFCSKAADVPAPTTAEAKESDTKDQLVSAVKASYAFCSEALGKMDDSKLGDSIEFAGHSVPRAMAALILASGWADHYSTAAMYLRLNGILPPSAQPKK